MQLRRKESVAKATPYDKSTLAMQILLRRMASCRKESVAKATPYDKYDPDGTRTRDLRRDRAAL